MFESFSASGFFVHTPCGPRKSGMPDSVEMPAPVNATTRFASFTQARTSSIGSLKAGSPVRERMHPFAIGNGDACVVRRRLSPVPALPGDAGEPAGPARQQQVAF